MKEVFIAAVNIYSPVGKTAADNFARVLDGVSGIRLQDNKALSDQPFYASLFDKTGFDEKSSHTKFDQLLIASITDALQQTSISPTGKRTLLILSSTKGNIDWLEKDTHSPEIKERAALPTTAKIIAQYFHMTSEPLVVSNACISGLLAILIGKRLIASGQYDHVIVAGADIVSKFVLSGFQSFMAVSPEPCQPFDVDRKGITLGEAAATMILTADKHLSAGAHVMAGSVSNDANHISAPSRTGNELAYIIERSIKDSGLSTGDIGFVSAHGTATLYNDEMEAKAIAAAGLLTTPVNSLKGFYGHTLGAAGLVESIISFLSMKENIILPTRGFSTAGADNHLHITRENISKPVHHFIKTASGFGGCNAAVVFGKDSL